MPGAPNACNVAVHTANGDEQPSIPANDADPEKEIHNDCPAAPMSMALLPRSGRSVVR